MAEPQPSSSVPASLAATIPDAAAAGGVTQVATTPTVVGAQPPLLASTQAAAFTPANPGLQQQASVPPVQPNVTQYPYYNVNPQSPYPQQPYGPNSYPQQVLPQQYGVWPQSGPPNQYAAFGTGSQPPLPPLSPGPIAPLNVEAWGPYGTKVQLRKTSDSLDITIPPVHTCFPTIAGLAFAAGWFTVLVFFVFISSVVAKKSWLSVVTIPFWLVGIFIVIVIVLIWIPTKIHIDSRTFRVSRGLTRTVPVNYVVQVQVLLQPRMGVPLIRVATGAKEFQFGAGLSRLELEWLANEINKYLLQIRNQSGMVGPPVSPGYVVAQ